MRECVFVPRRVAPTTGESTSNQHMHSSLQIENIAVFPTAVRILLPENEQYGAASRYVIFESKVSWMSKAGK